MNSRKSKAIRRLARFMAVQYVKDRLLSEEMCEGKSDKELVKAVPTHGYFRSERTIRVGYTSLRWFIKQLKKRPESTYQELLERAKI
jgi:hypothetical protein